MRGSVWTRIAAATGIDFVAVVVALGILGEVKDFENAGDFAVKGSNEMWATYTLLAGFAAIFFFWFTAIASARLRQLEWGFGGSGRLSASFFASGATIAGIVALSTGVQFAARPGGASVGLPALATALLEGPTLAFPIAVYILSAGAVGLRSEGLPDYSRWLALISVPTGAWFAASAGLQLFKNYAWLDETGMIVFLAWVLWLSVIGVLRWTELDQAAPTPPARAPAAPATTVAAAPARPRKARPRKPAARKR